VLPDGTKVWLNAASSIRYPTAFTGNERNVEITGEAYFEVAHNKDKPFHVKSNKQVVEVLGTHFNIMAYDDEPAVKTTLLAGKVRVTATQPQTTNYKQQTILQPGEQAVVSDKIKVAPVKTAAAVAWKNGEFMFRNEPLENIMRSVARWYDVEIVYKANVAHKEVWGSITRYGNVADVLEMIALTGVAHFKVEGRTIIVQG
jgi:ferric-dicitrate binding protein FerR (iron transport regulator)